MVPHLAWSDFQEALDWRQGEHITAIGPTGRGKTTLSLELLKQRDYVVVMACKPQDPLIESLPKQGYTLIRSWPPPEPRELYNKILFWPPIAKMGHIQKQRDAFRLALMDIYEAGHWCVYYDEARYLTQFLNLQTASELLWLQGRSLKISLVCGTQRPYWIPLSAYDQASHLFIWRDSDERNVKRLCEMASVNSAVIRDAIGSLDKHDFLYINTRTEEMMVSRVEEGRVAA